MKTTNPTPVLDADELYSGDNGRIFCGDCAGCSATYTGRDISGQRVVRMTAKDCADYAAEMIADGFAHLAAMTCE